MIVVTLDSDEVFIVASLCTRTDTQVIYVDPTTGALRHEAKLGFDLFKSQSEASDFITNGSRFACRSRTLVSRREREEEGIASDRQNWCWRVERESAEKK